MKPALSSHLLARVVFAGALLASGCSAASGAAPDAVPAGQYVALGDSYAAAPGISGQTGVPAGCGRSSASYPLVAARRLGLDSGQVHDESCAGATIADLTGPQTTSDGTNPAQLAALSDATTLVTLGIGGNDMHWSAVLTRCAELDLIPALISSSAAQEATPCVAYYTAGGADRIQQSIQAVARPLASTLAEIKRRAPRARVYVVGYPDLMPASGNAGCARTFGLTGGDMAFLNAEEQRLNSTLRQQADAAGAAFVDTYTPSIGHDACADPGQRWVEPWLPASPAYPMHPNAHGEQGMADAVISAIGAERSS